MVHWSEAKSRCSIPVVMLHHQETEVGEHLITTDCRCLVLHSFDVWNTAVQCLSVLDVLMSLAEYARSEGGDVCIPEFVLPSEEMKVW